MTLFKNKYRIESTRLQDWDYSSEGWYFVTICTWNREHLGGQLSENGLVETLQATIAIECWRNLTYHYHNCISEEFIVMPNHVHGIIILTSDNGVETGLKPVSTYGYVDDIGRHDEKFCGSETGLKPVSTGDGGKRYSLSEIIRGFKTFTARRINELHNTKGKPFWQARFYDHIIRNEESLSRIREYIQQNPLMWERDKNNIENLFM